MPSTRRHALIRLCALTGAGLPVAVARAQGTSTAVPAEVAGALPNATLRGQGTLRFLGLRVYDARLWVGPGFEPERFAQQPLALELVYARTLYGRLIAERSLEEMKRQGAVDAATGEQWLARMKALFPDVKEGDRITGVQQAGVAALFFLNARPLGDVRDAAFAERFFGIWRGAKTSEPGLRQALLGGG